MPLTPVEKQRYSRHLLLPEVGEEGQRRLKAARVLCIGAGGLGSPALLYLAAAGIGTIGIVDHDAVDLTNLQRQIVHGAADVGRAKVASVRDRIAAFSFLRRRCRPLIIGMDSDRAAGGQTILEAMWSLRP